MAPPVTAWVDAARRCQALVSVSHSLAPPLLSSPIHSLWLHSQPGGHEKPKQTACRMEETDGKDGGWLAAAWAVGARS